MNFQFCHDTLVGAMKYVPHKLWRLVWYCLYGLGVLAIMGFWWHATGHLTVRTAYSINLAIGNVSGLLGAYAILWQVILLGRLTFLENAFGLERLTVLHKWNGYTALTLILIHTVTVTLAFGAADHFTFVHQLVNFMFSWPDILKATIATALLIIIVFISIGIVRRGFKYETWYFVHIFTYLAILLAFGHQFSDGTDFVGQPLFRLLWLDMYYATFALLVIYRLLRPCYLMIWHQFKVDKVVRETSDVVSIYIKGKHLERFKYLPGQFIIWRFFAPGLWWQAHPFTISVAPNGQYLRITAKAVGDYTKQLPQLKPGTWVMLDGPHGNFTTAALSSPKVLFIAGGSGITPIRSILEKLPASVTDFLVLYAARSLPDLALRAEIEPLVASRAGTIKYVLSEETVSGYAHGFLTAENLAILAPDAADREVMLCGPPKMTDMVAKALQRDHVSHGHIHTERFSY